MNDLATEKKMDLFEWPQLGNPFTMDLLTQDISTDVLEVPELSSGFWDDYYPTELFADDISINPRESCSGASTQSGASTECTQSPSEADTNSNAPKARSTGRPRYPLQAGRDTNMNRIQRRRTQNRNSQRIYRQRRMEERNTFERRAIKAEENARNLQAQISELHSVITSLRIQLHQVQIGNAALHVDY